MYKDIYKLLMKLYNDDIEKVNTFLFVPNSLFGRFTPVGLILTGEGKEIETWVKNQLELKEKKKRGY